jgi:hypothetical protein
VYCRRIQGDSRPTWCTAGGYREIADLPGVLQVDTAREQTCLVYCRWIQGDSRPVWCTAGGYVEIAGQYSVLQVDTWR